MEQVKKIGGFKRSGAGEYACDWPWLFHLSLLGTFIRVDKVMYHKTRRDEGMSIKFKHTRANQAMAMSTCLHELFTSDLSLFEKVHLLFTGPGLCISGLFYYMQRSRH